MLIVSIICPVASDVFFTVRLLVMVWNLVVVESPSGQEKVAPVGVEGGPVASSFVVLPSGN